MATLRGRSILLLCYIVSSKWWPTGTWYTYINIISNSTCLLYVPVNKVDYQVSVKNTTVYIYNMIKSVKKRFRWEHWLGLVGEKPDKELPGIIVGARGDTTAVLFCFYQFVIFRNLLHIFSQVLGLSLGLFYFIFLYLILG